MSIPTSIEPEIHFDEDSFAVYIFFIISKAFTKRLFDKNISRKVKTSQKVRAGYDMSYPVISLFLSFSSVIQTPSTQEVTETKKDER